MMGAKLTFHGGIHPYDGKDLSKDKPIREVLPDGELVYPVSQHIGAPAQPIVQKGDHVLTGQMIAQASGFVSAPVFATVSGTVKAIEPRRVFTGDMVTSVIVENDGLYEEVTYDEVIPLDQMSKKQILDKIAWAGIVGMGGAGFPTHVKLSPKDPDKIDYVIANCAECEPYLTADYRLMLEKGFDEAVAYFQVPAEEAEIVRSEVSHISEAREILRFDDEIDHMRSAYSEQNAYRSQLESILSRWKGEYLKIQRL